MHNRRKKQEIKSSNGKGNSYKKECEQKQEKVMENVNSDRKNVLLNSVGNGSFTSPNKTALVNTLGTKSSQ